jgi:hypothetical protein
MVFRLPLLRFANRFEPKTRPPDFGQPLYTALLTAVF